jgi:hypothetical protein
MARRLFVSLAIVLVSLFASPARGSFREKACFANLNRRPDAGFCAPEPPAIPIAPLHTPIFTCQREKSLSRSEI